MKDDALKTLQDKQMFPTFMEYFIITHQFEVFFPTEKAFCASTTCHCEFFLTLGDMEQLQNIGLSCKSTRLNKTDTASEGKSFILLTNNLFHSDRRKTRRQLFLEIVKHSIDNIMMPH